MNSLESHFILPSGDELLHETRILFVILIPVSRLQGPQASGLVSQPAFTRRDPSRVESSSSGGSGSGGRSGGSSGGFGGGSSRGGGGGGSSW